jgi:hypothetical protein
MICPVLQRVASRLRFCAVLSSVILAAAAVGESASASTVIAYWDQNSNNLPGGGFGFLEGVFPQAASLGTGTLSVGGGLLLDTISKSNGDDVYQWIPSFGGTTVNAQPSVTGGGTISIQGGTENANNGGYFQFAFSMAGLTDLTVSYATQRTSTGFNSQVWSWSTDGSTFTDFQTLDSIPTAFADAGGNPIFSGPADLDNAATAFLRVTFDGATGSSGNNRLDNITFSAVPEPASIALAGLGVLGAGVALRRRAKRAPVTE